jgi:hypothetical protein
MHLFSLIFFAGGVSTAKMSPLGNFVRSFCAALLLSTLHLSAPATGDQQGKKKTESIWYISGNSNHIELATTTIYIEQFCL